MRLSDAVVDLHLAFVIGADREAHELVERHLIRRIDVEELWRRRREAEALPDHGGRDEESRRDLFLALAFLA